MAVQQTTHTPWIPTDETFGARLALIRQHLGGWNAAKTARLCGVDDQSWRNWEAGASTPQDYEKVCRKIADATGCSFAWLALGQNWKKMTRADLRTHAGGGKTTGARAMLVAVPDPK